MTYKNPPYQEPKNPVGTVAELFAGVGGFRVGLARAGWKTVYSNQWEPATKVQHASDVYVKNFGPEGHSNEDIATVSEIPAHFDLLVGGFPCQDYSVAKSAKSATGLEGKKGVLWWEILRLIELHKPPMIFLENVDRLLKSPTSQRGRDFAIMLTTLGSAGYAVEWRVVNAADYGSPQRRVRVFIVAKKIANAPSEADAAEYIFSRGTLARALPVHPDVTGVQQILVGADPTLVSERFNLGAKRSPFANAGFYLDGVAWTAQAIPKSERTPRTLGDILVDDSVVPREYWVDQSALPAWEYLKGAKSLDRVHKDSGFTYKYSEGRMAFPDTLTRPSRTILTAEGGATPSRFKHIIRTGSGYRRLVPVELERLNGFPDEWTMSGQFGEMAASKRAFFMGNALVVGLIEDVGKVLAEDHLRG